MMGLQQLPSVVILSLVFSGVGMVCALSERDILKTNRLVQVPFGREVYVDPDRDLQIQVRPGDSCQVKILNTDPLSQRPGKLNKAVFNCDFEPREVQYEHFGARHPSDDRVPMQIRYDSANETVIVPFTLSLDVTFVQQEVVTKNIPVLVKKPGTHSQPIDDKILQFTFDRETEDCRVSVLVENRDGLPRYGDLHFPDKSATLHDVECDDFLTMAITYKHSDNENSPDRDYIPMLAEVYDLDSGQLTKQEYFHSEVRIKGARQNSPPKVSSDAVRLMEVDQFVMTAITPEILSAVDRETPPQLLVFNISQPLGYGQGEIVSTDDRNLPLKSFTQQDVQDLKIAYKPPSIDSDVEREVSVEFQVLDRDGEVSDPFNLKILVRPMNTLAPTVTRNTGLQLFEGQSRPLLSFQNLQIADENNLKDVKISVLDGLRHGTLNVDRLSGRNYFTPMDLDAGTVVYEHDDSDTYTDNIIFLMRDGENEVKFLFPISIFPEDDEAPVLRVNTGLEVKKNEAIEMTPFILSATDADSEDDAIVYTLVEPFSERGFVMKRQLLKPDDALNWQHKDGFYQHPVKEWTQKDIVEGKLYYVNTAEATMDTIVDRWYFKLRDNHDPPNESGLKEFVVKIFPVDEFAPRPHEHAELQMNVAEYEMTRITRRYLHYTDDDSNDRELLYVITEGPHDTDSNSPFQGGRIALCDHPETELASFTQAQVFHHKVCYVPTDMELGIAPRVIQFKFRVEDTAGNSQKENVFTIYLKPVDNQPPRVRNTGFTILENGRISISSQMLDVTDADTDLQHIQFNVVSLPDHGRLINNGVVMEVGGQFSRRDIVLGRLFYENTGQEMEMDSFQLDVTDGSHHVPTTVKITVESVDDERPFLLRPGTVAASIKVAESSFVKLTTDHLKASDPDSNDLMLTFILESEPTEGLLLRGNKRVESFTQKDLEAGLMEYRHQRGEIGPNPKEDSFNLTLSDMSEDWVVGGNNITGVSVRVQITPTDNKAPVVVTQMFEVNEGDKKTLEAKHIDATDEDSDDNTIVCTILAPPTNGYLENIFPAPGSEKSREGIPISAFTIRDIHNDSINYVQSVHQETEPTEDRFNFQCSDGINQSPTNIFSVVIHPSNDEKPQLHVREFIVQEGGSLVIDSPIMYAVDKDRPKNNLNFSILSRPQHGRIVMTTSKGESEADHFTMKHVDRGLIFYQHDDTETVKDHFKVNLTDGQNVIEKEIPIMVIPVDDETPRLTINTGLDVEIAETKALTSQDLKATDLDSENANITFTISRTPSYGFLQRKIGNHIVNFTKGMFFAQWEIDAGHIQYMHTGRDGVRDLIKFDVSDGINPLIDRYFYVTIAGVDKVYPDVLNKGVQLPEKGNIVLNTNLLSTTDSNSPDEHLEFTITRAPSKGHLERTDNPGVPITRFTQLELAGNNIRYVHTSDDESKLDNFEFEVTDGYNPVFRTFRISLNAVDNKKPVLMFEPLRVREGSKTVITPFEMKVDDKDTKDGKLKFHIKATPQHGYIKYNNTKRVKKFSMQDLKENLISYHHDGTETTADSFSVVVTDGANRDFYVFPDTTRTTRRAQTIPIEIIPVDNGFPQLTTNTGATYLEILEAGGTGFHFTDKVLRAEDRDSPDEELVYSLTAPPAHGYVIHEDSGNRSISNWTQGDINNGKVFYLLSPGETSTQDSLTFKVADKAGNVLDKQTFELRWAYISFSGNEFTVREKDKRLQVTLRRRGYLGETSFVGLVVEDGSAKEGRDFRDRYADQVQFSPGDTEKTWKLRILDDKEFEHSEKFYLKLAEPVLAAIEEPRVATVTILDEEDESLVFIPEKKYHINESIGELQVPVRRSGDLSGELLVICSTVEDTAKGTVPRTVTSFSDYITRPLDQGSMLEFHPYQSEVLCPVTVIDDSLKEGQERFYVRLSMAVGGRLGQHNHTTVIIQADDADEPVLYFDKKKYLVDENAGYVMVKVWRQGTDLSGTSEVTVRSKRLNPVSAKASLDYVPVDRILKFASGVKYQEFKVTILDDLGRPTVEGEESFQLVLRMPVAATLGAPNTTNITISDTFSDLPSLEFKSDHYVVQENDGKVVTHIYRRGDLSQIASVRCYTRQATARVTEDFAERADTEDSRITFQPGEREKPCVVDLIGDSIHEEDESFRLVLGSPRSDSTTPAHVTQAVLATPSHTDITIKDDADQPVIKFGSLRLKVNEPEFVGERSRVRVAILRSGDVSQTSVVRVHTQDGTAHSTDDYAGFSKEITFGPSVTEQHVDVDILYDGQKEMREAFTIHLGEDKNDIAKIKHGKATVYIEEMDAFLDVTFPLRPVVVSLRDYERAQDAALKPTPGYPLVCITACDPMHPQYERTSVLCEKEGVNNSLTRYRWRVAAPTGIDGVTSQIQDVESSTFFTSTHQVTLDSIFFQPGTRVQCVARAVNNDGDPGLELDSNVVTVSQEERDGICLSRISDSVGAEPFTSKLRYTGPGDPDHPNMVKLTVIIPHRDGLLPAISTRVLSNFELALSPDAFRVGLHKCSNLLDFHEKETQETFLTEQIGNGYNSPEAEPHQYSETLRGNSTLRFYRNLNLESCMWHFTTYYTISELVNECGGDITADGQVYNLTQSYVSLQVPLYVSYIFHSPVATGGWQNYDLRTQLQLAFVYDTAILWQDGISAPEDSQLKGSLYPTSMRILKDNRLNVQFRTEARFRGQFIQSYSGTDISSTVTSEDHPDLNFDLELVRSEPTFAQPEQLWHFSSDMAIKDYSGNYQVKLVACTSSIDQEYLLPLECQPREAVPFDLQIRFQQISDPVPEEYSLNTQFHLLKNKELWLSDGSLGFGDGSDVSFTEDDEILGRVMVDPVQNLGSSFQLGLEKLFLCTGRDGYVPKYNPTQKEYGCVVDSPNLLHTFRLLDKGAPDTTVQSFSGLDFAAKLAVDDPEALQLLQQPGSDGFRMSAKPLFQVDSGRQWFLHAIYTVRSKENADRGSGKRSSPQHSLLPWQENSNFQRRKRGTADIDKLQEESGKGTNMIRISTSDPKVNNIEEPGQSFEVGNSMLSLGSTTGPLILGSAIFLIILIILIICVILCRRRSQHKTQAAAEAYGTDQNIAVAPSRVVAKCRYPYGDHSEV